VRKLKKFFSEFKEFISKGNVVDLAVAVVIGAAFGKIVTSLVDNIIMPLFGILVGQNFASLSVDINGSPLAYGLFIQAVVDFLIIAFCIFVFTKAINKFKKKEEKKEEAKKSEEVLLLEEIRDLLKKKNK
jgi:large conductance mechanosensitive channel